MKKLFILLTLPALLGAAEPVVVKNFDDGNKKDLVRFPAKTRFVQGKTGQGVHISGNYKQRNISGGVNVAIAPAVFTAPFTAEIWVKPDDKIKFNNRREIFGNGGDRGPGFQLFYFYNSIRLLTGDGKKARGINSAQTETFFQQNSWNHIAMTYDGKKKVKVYLNGNKIIDKDFVLTRGRTGITLGSYRRGFAYPFNGAIDSFRLYKKVKTQEEIIESYEKDLLQ